ncbi:MAG: cytochrome c oxidase subunit II [Burkholderiaceae bacterium]
MIRLTCRVACLAVLLPACSGVQSVFDSQGPQAREIATIAWVLFAGAAVIFIAVMALAAYALFANEQKRSWLTRRAFIIGAGVVFPLVTLSALLVYTFVAAATMAERDEAAPLRIEVVGEQWWWRVHYLDAAGGIEFVTANEIHLPIGRPIELRLTTADVIHSFWVPNLAGKLDMIPGRVNVLRLKADRAGVMRGQCAEYCGGPHALMALYAVAETPEEFERWRARQLAPAVADSPVADIGRALFIERGCGVCHAVRGTQAVGTRGPDLTHVGSRVSLAAGILPNNAGTLAGWIAHSQQIKPGNLMPSFAASFSAEELRTLAQYLHDLK